jgi:hypothetical protein
MRRLHFVAATCGGFKMETFRFEAGSGTGGAARKLMGLKKGTPAKA